MRITTRLTEDNHESPPCPRSAWRCATKNRATNIREITGRRHSEGEPIDDKLTRGGNSIGLNRRELSLLSGEASTDGLIVTVLKKDLSRRVCMVLSISTRYERG
jgi:hypothetical protein